MLDILIQLNHTTLSFRMHFVIEKDIFHTLAA